VRPTGAPGIVADVTPPIILIHGAWHGAWCWHKLVPLLEARGARVIAPDLPAMGADRTPPETVTLDVWARFVADVASREPGGLLVGHSRGGAVVSRAAELAPDAIRGLVYLSAYLLPPGDSVAAQARRDSGSLIAPNMIPAASGITCRLRESVLRDAFYGECGDEDFEFARARLCPEPLKPLATALRISDHNFARVPRAYIETARDRALTLGAQRRMQGALPCEPVYTLDTDHSPFLSQPEALARILISI
jgi:pimeloyl-ACP methyl ester carboxylesterase